MLRREDVHVVRTALEFEVEGQGKKWLRKRTSELQVEKREDCFL